MKKIKLLSAFVISFLIIFPSTLSAELTSAQFEIIKVAYMNGYTNAIQNDLETIMFMKKDHEKLKKHARVAVNDYMEKVSELNQGGMFNGNRGKRPASPSNSLSL
ncbi:MAG: hypothetical protein PVG39_12220 [Desulfobacteraceae bacterium]|jgi:DNA-binding protein YbaB